MQKRAPPSFHESARCSLRKCYFVRSQALQPEEPLELVLQVSFSGQPAAKEPFLLFCATITGFVYSIDFPPFRAYTGRFISFIPFHCPFPACLGLKTPFCVILFVRSITQRLINNGFRKISMQWHNIICILIHLHTYVNEKIIQLRTGMS
jgi:hypothetical protein